MLTMRVRCGWKRERVVQEGQCKGLSLGSKHIAIDQYQQLGLPLIRSFACFIHLTSQARKGITYYPSCDIITTIVDQSQ